MVNREPVGSHFSSILLLLPIQLFLHILLEMLLVWFCNAIAMATFNHCILHEIDLPCMIQVTVILCKYFVVLISDLRICFSIFDFLKQNYSSFCRRQMFGTCLSRPHAGGFQLHDDRTKRTQPWTNKHTIKRTTKLQKENIR